MRNGGYVQVDRVIAGETTQNNRIYVDNGTLKTVGDSIQLGTNDARCSGDGLYISGTNGFVRSGASVALSPESFIQFDIGRHGFSTTEPVLKSMSNIGVTTPVTADNPVTIRITDDDPKRIDGGRYTLIETVNGTINWEKIRLECPESVRIVEKTNKKLAVRVPSHRGLALIFR